MDYLIPKNVKARFEFFTGFGFLELGLVIAGLVTGAMVFGVLYLITGSLFAFITVIAGGAAGFFLGKRDPRTGMSAMVLFKSWKVFQSKQKRYFYRFGHGRIDVERRST